MDKVEELGRASHPVICNFMDSIFGFIFPSSIWDKMEEKRKRKKDFHPKCSNLALCSVMNAFV